VTEDGVRALLAPEARCVHTLQLLDVSSLPGVTLAFLSALPAGCALETLRADACGASVVRAALPATSVLRELSLQRCTHLRVVELSAHALAAFSASLSPKVARVSLTTPALQQLHVVHCKSLATLELLAPAPAAALREANLEGCSQLPAAAIRAFMHAAPGLRFCSLSGCWQLGTLEVPRAALLCWVPCPSSSVSAV
jgi:hypothetical protein